MGAPQIKRSVRQIEREVRRSLKRGNGVCVSIALDANGRVLCVGRNHEAVARELDRQGKQAVDIQDFGVAV